MTTTPKVLIQTVDTAGQTDEMDMETLAAQLAPLLPQPEPVEGEPLEVVSAQNPVHIAPGKTVTANLDDGEHHYLLVKKGQPCVLSGASTAEEHATVSTRIRVMADDVLTVNVQYWAHAKPVIKGEGWLTLVRERILLAGKPHIVWAGGWTPLVKA